VLHDPRRRKYRTEGYPNRTIFSPGFATIRTTPDSLLVNVYLAGLLLTLATPPGPWFRKSTARTAGDVSNCFASVHLGSRKTSSPDYVAISANVYLETRNGHTNSFAFSSS